MKRAAHHIIKRPLLTEKGTRLKEHGGAPVGTFTEETLKPQVLFEVAIEANKIEIKHAVEQLLGAKVSSIRTSLTHGKVKRQGRFLGDERAANHVCQFHIYSLG